MSREPDAIDPHALEEQTTRLRHLARGLVREFDADDVVQETCLEALTGRVKPRRGVAACLGGVVRNVAWKLRRGDARRGGRERRAARAEGLPSTADMVARLEMQRRVLEHVQALAEPYRSAILLRYFEDLPPREIARRLELPVETVKTRLKRALSKLRAAMDAGHGGSRRAWMAVLVPVAGLTLAPLATASTLASTSTWNTAVAQTGGVVSQGMGMKVAGGAVALLLLTGGALLFGGVFDAPDPEPGTTPDLMSARGAQPGLQSQGKKEAADDGDEATAAAGAEDATDATGDGAGATPRADAAEAAAGTPRALETDPLAVRPAVRHSPFGLPQRTKPGRRFGGGFGGLTGHWTKYGILRKPTGRSAIRVHVTDVDGNAVPGADVYLGPPVEAGVRGISFGDLRKLGKTDGSGRLHARALPHGGAAVFANYRNRLNGPGGLDGRHGKTTILRTGTTVAVELAVPFAVGKLGAVQGVVRGSEGQPLAGASVSLAWQQQWTRADGRFAFEGVPEGEVDLRIRRTGYANVRAQATVQAGAATNTTIDMEYAETGSVRIEGTVVGPQGEPVPNASIYLMITKDRTTNRSLRSDAQGRFVMEQLPDRLRTEAFRLQAGRIPHYDSKVLDFEDGIKDERVTLKLPVRWVQLELRILDAATDEIVHDVRVRAHRPESRRPDMTIMRDYETGYRKGMVEPGRHTVSIEALDHEDMEIVVDVKPDADWNFRHTVKLERTSPPTVPINLTVLLTDQVTGKPIERAKIEVTDKATDEALSRFEGRREGGEFLMAGLSGDRKLVVTSEGYERYAAEHTFDGEAGIALVEVALRPQ